MLPNGCDRCRDPLARFYDWATAGIRLAVFVIINRQFPALLGPVGLVSLEWRFLSSRAGSGGIGVAGRWYRVPFLFRGIGIRCFQAHVAHLLHLPAKSPLEHIAE